MAFDFVHGSVRALATVVCCGAMLMHGGPAAAQAGSDPEYCVDVNAGGAIAFAGRKLVETPDIRAPEIRLANVLVSSRCWERADEILAAYAAAHPSDHHVFFVYARIAWIGGNRNRAEAMIRTQIQAHPKFTSMKVLLASMHIDDGNLAEAARLLDEIQAAQPTDLWAYIDRLRIEALVAPTPKLVATLRTMATDPRFPPSARGQALQTLRALPDPGGRREDEMFAVEMNDPVLATDCRLARKAQELLEIRNDAAGAAALLEKYIDRNAKCYATQHVRTVLAQAYLTQAAALSPVPDDRTRRLYDQARAVLQDDFTPLAAWLAIRTEATGRLKGYLLEYTDFRRYDGTGESLLCRSIGALNVTMVELTLEHGASVEQTCDGMTVVDRVLSMATSDRAAERQGVLRALLTHGAPVEGLDSCASPANGDCRNVLLPILKEFAGRKPAIST